MTRNVDKFLLCLESGALFTLINMIIGKIDYSIIMLFIVMFIDFVTGVVSGIKLHELSSTRCFNGLCKKFMILVYVILAHHFDILLNIDYVRMGVCYMYIVSETISIFENGVKLGVDIPEPIKKTLDILQSKEKEGLNNGD